MHTKARVVATMSALLLSAGIVGNTSIANATTSQVRIVIKNPDLASSQEVKSVYDRLVRPVFLPAILPGAWSMMSQVVEWSGSVTRVERLHTGEA